MDLDTTNRVSRLCAILEDFFNYPGQNKTEFPGFDINVREKNLVDSSCIALPSITLILSGRKRAMISGSPYEYGKGQVLVLGTACPDLFTIMPSARYGQFMCASFSLDKDEVMQIESEIAEKPGDETSPSGMVAVLEGTDPIIGCFERAVSLLQTPADIPMLAPMIRKELIYRILTNKDCANIRKLYSSGMKESQIRRAMWILRQDFAKEINISDLAASVNMSQSSFYRYFKEVAGISPLQFRKEIRLIEAKRLITQEYKNVSTACFSVGYESQTQFSREYKRYFGVSPMKDLHRFRGEQESMGIAEEA